MFVCCLLLFVSYYCTAVSAVTTEPISLNSKKSHGISYFPSLRKAKDTFANVANLKQSVLRMVSESRTRRLGGAKISEKQWDECVTSKFQFVTMSEFETDMTWVAKTISSIQTKSNNQVCFLTQGGIKKDLSGLYTGKSGDWMLGILSREHFQLPCVINFQMGDAPFAKELPRLEAALSQGYKTFIIVDDGAYSGKQITFMEGRLRETLAKHKIETHFVIPYVSATATTRIESKSPSATIHFKNKMPMMTCTELKSLISPTLPLFAFEHKIPDEQSLDPVIGRQLTMFLKAHAEKKPWPPYKQFELKKKVKHAHSQNVDPASHSIETKVPLNPSLEAKSNNQIPPQQLSRKPSLERKQSKN